MVLGPGGKKQLQAFARVGAVGIELALSTVIGLLGGQWLDGKLGTTPLLTIVGLLIGITAGFRSLIRAAKQASEQAARGDKGDQDDDTKAKTDDPHHHG